MRCVDGVVLMSPKTDERLYLLQGVEDFVLSSSSRSLPLNGSFVVVLPGAAGLNEQRLHLYPPSQPLATQPGHCEGKAASPEFEDWWARTDLNHGPAD